MKTKTKAKVYDIASVLLVFVCSWIAFGIENRLAIFALGALSMLLMTACDDMARLYRKYVRDGE